MTESMIDLAGLIAKSEDNFRPVALTRTAVKAGPAYRTRPSPSGRGTNRPESSVVLKSSEGIAPHFSRG